MAAHPRGRVQVREQVITRVKARIEERAHHVTPHRLTVGIHEAEGMQPKLDYDGQPTHETVVRVAAAHELGRGVPERSWLRTWFDNNRARIGDEMVAAMRAEYAGDREAIKRQGDEWSYELRQWIEAEEGGLSSLEPSTIAAKERAQLDQPETPLYATGQIVEAIKSMLDGG